MIRNLLFCVTALFVMAMAPLPESCPAPKIVDEVRGGCVCPPGMVRDAIGVCVPRPKCPPGTKPANDRCICPPGTNGALMVNGQCTGVVWPPEGTNRIGQ